MGVGVFSMKLGCNCNSSEQQKYAKYDRLRYERNRKGKAMNLTIDNADVPEKVLEALNGCSYRIEKVRQWGQRTEPKPLTPIYQNTPWSDNPPAETGIVLDHGWRDMPVTPDDRVGIYLGYGVVLTVGR